MSYFRLTQLLSTLLLSACLGLTVHAEPASVDALRTMLQALESEQQINQAMQMLEQQHAATVAQETDPEKKATKQRQHEAVAELLRQEMSWEKFEPMAIEAYAKHLQKQDVEAMNDFLGSADGKVYTQKYLPALLKGTMLSMQLAEERADLLHAALTNEATPLPEPMSAPKTTDDPSELAARKILKTFYREKIETQMSGFSENMKKQLAMLGPYQELINEEDMSELFTQFETAFKQDMNIDAYLQPIVKEFSSGLSEKELNGLFEAFSKPEWKPLENKMEAGNTELNNFLGKYMQEQVLPKVFHLLMNNS